MTPTIYALLVGINEYQGSVPTLRGCVNDVARFKEFLELRTQGGEYGLSAQILTSGDPKKEVEIKPTRQAIIDAFHNHLGQAKEGDIALFYYSGHGSQERAPMEFWHLEPDRLDETLVLFDSRIQGGWDLADKELSVLIAELASNNPQILVVLDSCHSGSGTRAPEGTGIRLAPTDTRHRPVDTFLPGVIPAVKALSPAGTEPQETDEKTGGWFSLPQGRHIVISACRPEQSAREKLMPDDQVHGILSYYLLDTLQQASPTLTYRDLFSRTSTLVRSLVIDQNPLLAATNADDLRQPFLGGAIVDQKPYAILEYQKRYGWVLKAGAIHGIEPPMGEEKTHLAVFPIDTILTDDSSLEGDIARAIVVEVGASESLVEIEEQENNPLNIGEVYKAVVTATPLKLIDVYLSGDDHTALDLLRKELEGSLLVRVGDDASRAAIYALANRSNDSYLLARAGDQQPLKVSIPDKGSPASARAAATRVQQIAQWLGVLNLENKHSQLPVDAVQLELFSYDFDKQESQPLDRAGPIRLSYNPQLGEEAAQFQLRIRHTGSTSRKLYCMLVDLSDDFAINTDTSLFGSGIWLEPSEEVWATNEYGGKFIAAYVPDKSVEMGITQVSDVLKLIVSTDESDATLLRQDGLELAFDQQTRGLTTPTKDVPDSTLHRMLQRVQTRSLGSRPPKVRLSDWRTTQVQLTIVCQAAGVEIPIEDGQTAELADGITIASHPAFKARAQLETFKEGKRNLGNMALPSVFRAHPNLSRPFDFSPTRGGDAGASVIVLKEVANYQSVTSESPLVIRSAGGLEEDEVILPVAYDPDSKLFLPLGLGVKKEVGWKSGLTDYLLQSQTAGMWLDQSNSLSRR